MFLEVVVEARAKVTSKGQVTIPVEVRRELGVKEGDTLVFEVAGNYATLHRKRPILEVVAELQERYPKLLHPRPITNRQAIEEYFDEEYVLHTGPTLYVGQPDGSIKTYGEPDPDFEPAEQPREDR